MSVFNAVICLVFVLDIGHRAASENRSISRVSHTTYSSTGPWMTDQTDQVHKFKSGMICLKLLH